MKSAKSTRSKTIEIGKKNADGFFIGHHSDIGIIRTIGLFNHDILNGIPLAYAMVTETPNNDATLYFIYTDKRFRRKGYAKRVIKLLKTLYSSIQTQRGSVEGAKLCKKCGFKKVDDLWIKWEKEKIDGNDPAGTTRTDGKLAVPTGEPSGNRRDHLGDDGKLETPS